MESSHQFIDEHKCVTSCAQREEEKKYSVSQIVEVELVAQSDKADLVKSNRPHLDS